MNSRISRPQPSVRVDGQPRIFAIVFLGRGVYALDIIELPKGPRRLRRGRSVAELRRAMGEFSQVGDLLLMSEALRALELSSVPLAQLRQLEGAGIKPFDIHGEVESMPAIDEDGDDQDSESCSVEINFDHFVSIPPQRLHWPRPPHGRGVGPTAPTDN